MNAMLLLEAVGFLDEDLLERSEQPFRHKHRWIQWVAMAACACVIFVGAWGFLFSSKSSDSAMEGDMHSPQDPADDYWIQDNGNAVLDTNGESFFEGPMTDNSLSTNHSFAAWYILTGGEDAVSYPQSFVIKDRQSLEEYYATHKEILKDSDFEEATSKYYDVYFETNQLIVLVLQENNGSVTHRVTEAYWDEDTKQWQVSLQRMIPLEKSQAVARSYWHILIEVDAVESGEEEKVQLRQTTYREIAQNEWTFVD